MFQRYGWLRTVGLIALIRAIRRRVQGRRTDAASPVSQDPLKIRAASLARPRPRRRPPARYADAPRVFSRTRACRGKRGGLEPKSARRAESRDWTDLARS